MANSSTTTSPFTPHYNDTDMDRFNIELSLLSVILNVLYYSLIVPIAVIGNALTVAVSHRILRYRQSIPDMMTGTLAAFDLLNVVSVHTPAIISTAEGEWKGGSYVCSYQYFMAWSCLKTSFFIIIVLTVDRYIALVKPFYYRAKITLRKMKVSLLVLIFFSFASTSVTIIWFSEEISLLPNWYLCMNTWGKASQYYSYILAFYGGTFIIGVIVFNVCNMGIVCSLIRHKKRAQQMRLRVLSEAQERRERRVTKIIEGLSVVFMLFWMPYLMFIVLNQTDVFYSDLSEDLSIRVLFANTLLNPVIYGVFNKTYRKGYIYFVRKLLFFILCGKIKKPKEQKIFFLRRSYLQHRLARKTRSHSSVVKPNEPSLPVELTNDEPLQQSVSNSSIARSHCTSQLSARQLHLIGLNNTGFTFESDDALGDVVPPDGKTLSESKVFTICDWEEIGSPSENGCIENNRCSSCSHRYSNGHRTNNDASLSSVEKDMNVITDSTWL